MMSKQTSWVSLILADQSKRLSGKADAMAKKIPLQPKYPERICWGCDKYCSVDDLRCGNGSGRTQHPIELLGEDWYEHGDWGIEISQDNPRSQADQADDGSLVP